MLFLLIFLSNDFNGITTFVFVPSSQSYVELGTFGLEIKEYSNKGGEISSLMGQTQILCNILYLNII